MGSSRKGRAEEEGQAVSRGVREFLSLAGQEAGPVCLCSPHPLQDARSRGREVPGPPGRWRPGRDAGGDGRVARGGAGTAAAAAAKGGWTGGR